MVFEEARPSRPAARASAAAQISVIEIGSPGIPSGSPAGVGGNRMNGPAAGPGSDRARTRRLMRETLFIIDAAATSLSAPLLTSPDLAAARRAHEAAAQYLSARDVAGLAGQSAAFHRIMSSRCPNRRLRELLAEELALAGAAREPEEPDWAALARAVREHDRLLRLAQTRPDSTEIGPLIRAHWQACA